MNLFLIPIQKTLICCCSNTYIPPHYHKFAHQSELFIRLKGCFSLLIFSVDGVLTRRITIDEEILFMHKTRCYSYGGSFRQT
ncbi:WbuC family cupin fold metalloprotein [Escherichia coli]